MLILALVGLAVSLYLSYSKLLGVPVSCSLLSGCQAVEESKYSEIFGIPVAFLGVLFYMFLIISTFIRISEKYQTILTKLIFFATLIGFIYSIYLTYLELFVIFAICIYCVTSAVTSTGLFFVSLYENMVLSRNQNIKKYE